MKILDACYLSITNIKKNKIKFLKNILLISFSLSILIISSIATNSINNVINKNIRYNLSHRSIYVRNHELINQENLIMNLENINHISKVITQEEYSVSVDVNSVGKQQTSGSLSLIGSNNSIYPPILAGRKIEANERNVCIIPKKFKLKNTEDFSENIIDGEKLLGKEIEIVYYNYDYSKNYPERVNTIVEKYTVVGIYDQDLNMGEYNECYINFEDVLKIQNEILKNSNYSNTYSSVIAIVDNAENVNNVLNELEKKGYDVHLRSTPNTKLVSTIEVICIVFSVCVMLIAISNIIINTIKSAEERKNELGLLKAFGYNNGTLWKLVITESIITAIISFILSCLLSMILVLILYTIIKNSNSELERITIVIKYNIFIVVFFIAFVILLFINGIVNYNIIKKATILKNIKN